MKQSGGVFYNILTWNTAMDNTQTYALYKEKNITEQEAEEKKKIKLGLILIMGITIFTKNKWKVE